VAKYRSLMPSLALIGHLIDGVDGGPTGPVSRGAAARAVGWCEFLQEHARRLYESVTDRAQVAPRCRRPSSRTAGCPSRSRPGTCTGTSRRSLTEILREI
jgi:hypothetical protein